jgi:hypothetical protein
MVLQANASKSKHTANISLYQVSSCQIKCRRATWFRGSAPSWSRTRNRGQGAKPGTGPAWGRLGLLANLALLALLLITTHSRHSTLEALRAVRCASCQPPGNLLAGEIQRLDSEAATPMDPDLLHASRMHQM